MYFKGAVDLLLHEVGASLTFGSVSVFEPAFKNPDIVLFRADELFLASSRATFLALNNSRFMALRDASLPCPFFIYSLFQCTGLEGRSRRPLYYHPDPTGPGPS